MCVGSYSTVSHTVKLLLSHGEGLIFLPSIQCLINYDMSLEFALGRTGNGNFLGNGPKIKTGRTRKWKPILNLGTEQEYLPAKSKIWAVGQKLKQSVVSKETLFTESKWELLFAHICLLSTIGLLAFCMILFLVAILLSCNR